MVGPLTEGNPSHYRRACGWVGGCVCGWVCVWLGGWVCVCDALTQMVFILDRGDEHVVLHLVGLSPCLITAA